MSKDKQTQNNAQKFGANLIHLNDVFKSFNSFFNSFIFKSFISSIPNQSWASMNYVGQNCSPHRLLHNFCHFVPHFLHFLNLRLEQLLFPPQLVDDNICPQCHLWIMPQKKKTTSVFSQLKEGQPTNIQINQSLAKENKLF